MKISIITPSYNQGEYIEQTIDSVLSQNYLGLEYIVIDGGSTDNTIEIIKKYEKYLAYWVSEKDEGQSDAINKGLSIATGEIVNWINSDDYYEKGALYAVADAFEVESVNVVCGKGKIVRANGELVRYSRGTDVYEQNLEKTIGWARMDQPETFFRRSVIQKIGYLNEHLHYLMDRDLWIRYLLLYKLQGIKEIPDVIINFRLHEASKTVSQLDKFQVDHDSFFYSMAKQYDLYAEKECIKKISQINESFVLNIPLNYQKDIIQKILSYYFLKRADELYAANERKKVQACMQQVRVNYLSDLEKKLYKKLAFRNTYVPVSVLQLFRKN